jgi:hypothetical protein
MGQSGQNDTRTIASSVMLIRCIRVSGERSRHHDLIACALSRSAKLAPSVLGPAIQEMPTDQPFVNWYEYSSTF